jgi:cobalt-zinc-cadmium efflux system protein
MGHHHHHAADAQAGDARVALAIAVNLGLTVAQIVGGILSGSLALIADALHNLSDAVSLIIAFAARRIARRPADANMTFGYRRAEVVAALMNYTTLIVLGLYLAYEAIMRFFDPSEIDGWLVVIIAGLALLVDAVTAALTYAMSKDSMNIRAAFLHNLADALGSIAVIVAGVAILLYDWRLVDPLVTLGIAGYILWMCFAEIGGVIRILMLGSDPQIDAEEVLESLRRIEGVKEVHHLHLWQMDEHESSADLHVVVEPGAWSRAEAIKDKVKSRLNDLAIGHSTIELECAENAGHETQAIGH